MNVPQGYSPGTYASTVGMGGTRSNGQQPNQGRPQQQGAPQSSAPWMPNGGAMPYGSMYSQYGYPTTGGAQGGASPYEPPTMNNYAFAGQTPPFNPAAQNAKATSSLGSQYLFGNVTNSPKPGDNSIPGNDYNRNLALEDSYVKRYQDYAKQGVQGYGDIVGQDLSKNVGNMLGDLNGIGALRSGAVQSGVNDFATQYGRQVGDYASMATQNAVAQGQQGYDLNVERRNRDRQRNDQRGQAIGQMIGQGLGFAAGAFI